jgi:hypothetical protein
MNKLICFAKLFEIEYYQVLITKDDVEDGFNITQHTDLGDVRPSMAIGFNTEEKRDKCFDDYSKNNAEKFLSIIQSMLK